MSTETAMMDRKKVCVWKFCVIRPLGLLFVDNRVFSLFQCSKCCEHWWCKVVIVADIRHTWYSITTLSSVFKPLSCILTCLLLHCVCSTTHSNFKTIKCNENKLSFNLQIWYNTNRSANDFWSKGSN